MVIWLGKFGYFGKAVAQKRRALTKGRRKGRFDCSTICYCTFTQFVNFTRDDVQRSTGII